MVNHNVNIIKKQIDRMQSPLEIIAYTDDDEIEYAEIQKLKYHLLLIRSAVKSLEINNIDNLK